MIIKQFSINSSKEINKLKKELMEISGNSGQSFQTNSSSLKRFRNTFFEPKSKKHSPNINF